MTITDATTDPISGQTSRPGFRAPSLPVALVTLGCARNDARRLRGTGRVRLEDGGFELVNDPEDADTVVVNTCGFVESAKKDSVDTILEASDLKAAGRTQQWSR